MITLKSKNPLQSGMYQLLKDIGIKDIPLQDNKLMVITIGNEENKQRKITVKY